MRTIILGGCAMRDLYSFDEIEDLLEERITEYSEPVRICGYEYDAGRALRSLDEMVFHKEIMLYVDAYFKALDYDDLSEEERKHYYCSVTQIMYGRK